MEQKFNFTKLEVAAFERYSDLAAYYRVYNETSGLGRADLLPKMKEVVNAAESVWDQVEEVLEGVKGDGADHLRFNIKKYREKLEEVKNACGLDATQPNA